MMKADIDLDSWGVSEGPAEIARLLQPGCCRIRGRVPRGPDVLVHDKKAGLISVKDNAMTCAVPHEYHPLTE